MVVMSIEWKGPLWSMKGTRRSKSGRMEIRNSRGMFTLTLNSFDVAFPDKYPRARCPTAYEVHHSWLCFVSGVAFLPVLSALRTSQDRS